MSIFMRRNRWFSTPASNRPLGIHRHRQGAGTLFGARSESGRLSDQNPLEFTINLEVEFEYFEEGHHYEHVNSSYPRFIAEENLVDVEGSTGEAER
jgi:hypothetical protein